MSWSRVQDPDVFPADCVSFADSIPGVALDDCRPGAMLEVIVGEVYSPSHFWYLRLGQRYNLAMEDMMDDMALVLPTQALPSRCSFIC